VKRRYVFNHVVKQQFEREGRNDPAIEFSQLRDRAVPVRAAGHRIADPAEYNRRQKRPGRLCGLEKSVDVGRAGK
jgi:hypothetical protein